MRFGFSSVPLNEAALRATVSHPTCGGFVAFEGWVRNHNEGRSVVRLTYEAFEPLAIHEGERIVAEAIERFRIERAACVHRLGTLAIGENAVWVGVAARHRDEAFRACRYIIDEIKHRVPIWKKEHYEEGDSGWVNCERCESHAHDHSALPVAPRADYSRQMVLKEVGSAGQDKLRRASVLVVGCGGLGVPVMAYLAGAGIGRLGLVDGDLLEASNLHRQPFYDLAQVGQLKVELAAARLHTLNPEVEVRTYPYRLDGIRASEIIEPYTLVIDCTDNFAAKFMLNDTCVGLGKPVIFSSIYQYEGQLQVVRPDRGGPCLRCLWPQSPRDGLIGNCAEAGVLGPVPGTFGTLQALEALKLLLDLPGQLTDEVLIVDLLKVAITRVRAQRSPDCPDHARIAGSTESASVAAVELAFGSLDQALEAGFQIIDIRERAEIVRLATPCPSARHLPLAELLHGAAPLPQGKYLLVCASGKRSLAAAQALRARGYDDTFSLRGGIAQLSPDAKISTA